MKRLCLLLLLLALPLLAAPGGDVALVHGVVHRVSAPAVHDATVVVHDGRIASVSAGAPPAGATVVDLHGLHLYPSLIESDSTLGLVEIEEVRATRDDREVGSLNPDVRGDIAFNPDSMLLPVAMSSGILVADVAPSGGLVSGRSAVMMLNGWTREDMTVRTPAALYITWPRMTINRAPDAKPSVEEQEKVTNQRLRDLREAFGNARAYLQARTTAHPPEQDIKWESMAAALRGEIPVVVEANGLDEIQAALSWAQEEKLKMVLLGGADAWRMAGDLARAKVPVIMTAEMQIPWGRDYEAYDTYYKAPAELARAGVTVALASGRAAARARDLRDLAGRAAAYGMPADTALRSITLSPAEVFGVADRLGSIDPGKDATFFAADGDILDVRTHVVRAWLRGREVDLSLDRQKKLYDKYRNRPPQISR